MAGEAEEVRGGLGEQRRQFTVQIVVVGVVDVGPEDEEQDGGEGEGGEVAGGARVAVDGGLGGGGPEAGERGQQQQDLLTSGVSEARCACRDQGRSLEQPLISAITRAATCRARIQLVRQVPAGSYPGSSDPQNSPSPQHHVQS